MRRVALLLGVMAAVLVVASPATADPSKTNCPNGTDWAKMTVDDAAATVWPLLVDQSPWANQDDFRDTAVVPYDKNDDGYICLKTNAQSNPNANWYGFPYFVPRDNNANAST